MSKYYAVANGRQIGIFRTWDETKALVNGFKGAKYKSFKTLQEAQDYLSGTDHSRTDHSRTDHLVVTAPNRDMVTTPLNTETFGNTIVVYTDGSCIDKVGGFGYLVIRQNMIMPVCGRVPTDPCTNQIAELYAIWSVIGYVLVHRNEEIVRDGMVIYTDSKYSIGCLSTWYHNWQRNGWFNSKGEPVSNKELIQAIIEISVGLKIEYRHVKAHNGHKYNEWADRLANEGRAGCH